MNPDTKKILITGGTSGLGLELVRLYLGKGWHVVATGRNPVTMPDHKNRFEFHKFDLADMSQTAEAAKQLSMNHNFSAVINNAGVFGPPRHCITVDGNEYTFQVNFLSQLLLNDIILRDMGNQKPLTVAAVISPVYRLADADNIMDFFKKENYKPFSAYSASKMCLALMCGILPDIYSGGNLRCMAFSPGVFSSAIFRSQKPFLRQMYQIAAPFMKSPEKAARRLADIIESEKFVNGYLYTSGSNAGQVLKINQPARDLFLKDFYEKTETFRKQFA